MVLISLRYSTAYPVVFRYFGFAVATVLVRLALTAPRVVDAGLGIAATLCAANRKRERELGKRPPHEEGAGDR